MRVRGTFTSRETRSYEENHRNRLSGVEKGCQTSTCHLLPDEELLELTALGRREALEILHSRYVSVCQRIALRIVSDPSLAEDLVQDVFLKLWANPLSFRGGRGRFSSWLFALVHNRSIDELRSRKRKTTTWASLHQDDGRNYGTESSVEATPGSIAEPYEELWRDEEQKAVCYALDLLPTGPREALRLAYWDGLTQKEVAERLEVPLGTIKTRTSRGLFHLRGLLAAQGMAARNYED